MHLNNNFRILAVAVAFCGITLVGACGGPTENAASSPAAPSSSSSSSGSSSRNEVKLEGVVSALSGTCPNLSFTVNDQRILTNRSTKFQEIACPGLQNGVRLEIEGFRQTNGTVLASKVEGRRQQPAPAPMPGAPLPAPGAGVEIEGFISDFSGTCPTLTFLLNGFRVLTTAATEFERIPCSALRNGIEVEVKGVSQSNGTVLAVQVEPEEQKFEGLVSALVNGCPTRSFLVAGERFVTTGSTRFDDVSCGGLQNGMSVEVRGVRLPDGSFIATRIKRQEIKDVEEQRLEGTVADLSGLCPDRSFRVNGRRVAASAQTRFDDVTCSALANNMRVEVRGFPHPDGTLQASRIRRR